MLENLPTVLHLPMIDSFKITLFFIFVLSVKMILEILLELKNKKYILKNRTQVPEKFAAKVSLEEHQKAADYSVAKINSGIFFEFISLMVLLMWTLGGGLNMAAVMADTIIPSNNVIWNGVFLFGIFGLVSFILTIPENIYTTFFLEEKFGFNKTTIKTFIFDIIKGLTLAVILGVPILAAIIWIMNSLGTFWWAYAWAFMTVIQIIMILIYPNFIAPLFNKFTPLEEGQVKEKIVQLLKKVDFSHKELFVMDASKRSSHGNAYFTGLGKKKRIVFFDTLLKKLSAEEIEAVLAHELGHFKKKHILKMILKSIFFNLIGLAILGALYSYMPFYYGHGVKLPPSPALALILFSMLVPVYTFLLTPINAYFSRKNEFEADNFAVEFSSADHLVSALVKLYKENASTLTPDPFYSSWYHSHPPALIRVEHLEKIKI